MQNEKLGDLPTVLNYRNDRVLNKFRTQFAVSMEQAEDIFAETLKWLWVCAKHLVERNRGTIITERTLVIHVSMVIIDEFWHTFILHTRDYMDFCQKHLGFYLHHSPAIPNFVPLTEEQTRSQLEYLWENLGEETVVKWYECYQELYSPERLAGLIRPHEFGKPCEVVK